MSYFKSYLETKNKQPIRKSTHVLYEKSTKKKEEKLLGESWWLDL